MKLKAHTLKTFKNILLYLILFFFSIFYENKLIFLNASENELSLNKEITFGKLDNGLTYYIKKNSKPKGKASIHLILKAGSLVEDDDQLGLAHLIEHMVFNGTKKYPNKEIDNYLSSIGLELGSDYNASTGFETTNYKLTIPTDDLTKIDKGINILSEMVGYASLTDEAFDKEREVIEEEWRSGLGASQRLYDDYQKLLFKNSKFSKRKPIGDMKIIKNFSYEDARRFYKDWYRPDLMGVIAVGDFDPNFVKKKIEKHFGRLVNKSNRLLPDTLLPKYNETIFLNQTDEEQKQIIFTIINKNKIIKLNSTANYKLKLIDNLISSIFLSRFDKLDEKEKKNFNYAGVYSSKLTSKTGTKTIYGSLKENKIQEGLLEIFQEIEIAKQNGFIKDELSLIKQKYIDSTKQSLKAKETRTHNSHIAEISRNFLYDEFVIGEEREYQLDLKLLKTITVEDLNKSFKNWFNSDDRIIRFIYPKKISNQLSKKDFLLTENLISNKKLSQYKWENVDKTLINKKLTGSKIISEKLHSSINTLEFDLENGIKVFFKKTKHKANKFSFKASSYGGTSHANKKDLFSAKQTSSLINTYLGYGPFSKSQIELKKDDETFVNVSFSQFYENLSGGAKKEKLEELFKLIYLRFLPLEIDPIVFDNYLSNLEESKKNEETNQETNYQRKIFSKLCKNHYRYKPLKLNDVKKIKSESIVNFYNDRFFDSSDFVFTFVGDIELENFKRYVELYLGSLPNKKRLEKFKNNAPICNGKSNFLYKKNVEKSAKGDYVFNSKFQNTPKERAVIHLSKLILDKLIFEEIRENQKLVYSAGYFTSLNSLPTANHIMYFYFETDPKKKDLVFDQIDQILLKIKTNNFDDKYLINAKKKYINDLEQSKQSNNFWISVILNRFFDGEKFSTIENIDKTINSILKEDISNYFKNSFNDNFVKASFLPKE